MSPIAAMDDTMTLVSVSCGPGHTCVVNEEGEAYCFGSNYYGQLGVTGVMSFVIPVQITGLGLICSVWLRGSSSFFVMREDKSIMATDQNAKGVLGLGDTENRQTLSSFGNGKAMIKEICGGVSMTCDLDEFDSIHCVGNGASGQLGCGSTASSFKLVSVMMPTLEPAVPLDSTEGPTVLPTKEPTSEPIAILITSSPTRTPTSEPIATSTTFSLTPATPSIVGKKEEESVLPKGNEESNVLAVAVAVPVRVVVVVLVMVALAAFYRKVCCFKNNNGVAAGKAVDSFEVIAGNGMPQGLA